MSASITIENAREVRLAFQAQPKIMFSLIRQELKRAGKRFERIGKKKALSGRPGILLPKTGSDKRKAQKGQIKSRVVFLKSEDSFVLLGKGSRFLGYHKKAGKTIPIEASLRDAVKGLGPKIANAAERSWQIAANRHLAGRF